MTDTPRPSSTAPAARSGSASPNDRHGTPTAPRQTWPRLAGPRLWALLGLIGVLFAYRLWVIDHTGISLFFDEAQYWDWSRHLAWGYFSKPPLIAGIIGVSTWLFGSGVIGVKVLTMAMYPAAALAMVLLARALWPTSSGVRTGVVAGALFMTIPMVGLMGLFASTDAPLILCWTLASWALWRAQVTNRLIYWVALGLACGIGAMGKYTMTAFVLTALWTLWAVHGPKRGLLRAGPWVSVALTLLCLLPNVLWNIDNGFPTLAHTVELTAQSQRAGGIVPTLVFLAGQVLMLGPLSVLAAVLLWRTRADAGPAQGAASQPSQWWAASSHMLAPSQWQASAPPSQATHSQLSGERAAHKARKAAKSSAYYLASVSSYRYLWAMSLPLQLVAVVQALHADAHVNWAAPSMVGFTLLIASRLSAPLQSLSVPRPNRWLLAVLLSNVVLTSATLHLRDIVGPTLPSKLDVLVRMRGWHEAFAELAPVLDDPVVKGLPVLTDTRLLITEAAYEWRAYEVKTLDWNPKGLRTSHYQMTRSLPNKVGADMLLVTDRADPVDITQRFAITRLLKSATVPVGPDRALTLHVYFLRGFLGYDDLSYQEQSGGNAGSPAP